VILRLWRCRWSAIRLAVALALLAILIAEHGARLARLQLAAMPDFDFAGEVRSLRLQGRYAEAATIARAGEQALAESPHPDAAAIDSLRREKQLAIDGHSSTLRRLRDAGFGALSGTGDSLEGVLGALAADMLVVGDVRDLAIQSAKLAVDGQADPVIAGLSALGLATTLAPEIDWGPAILKIARKMGSLSDRLADHVLTLVRAGRRSEALAIADNVAVLARATSPGTAVRLLRHADDPAEIARLARFAEKTGTHGALALHVAGKDAARLATRAAEGGAGAEKVILRAATKGPAGIRWSLGPGARSLMHAHPILGLAKGLWKGHLTAALTRALERLDAHGWWLVPLLAAWVFVEIAWIIRRLLAPTANPRVAAPEPHD
jgi:hypothetical protein